MLGNQQVLTDQPLPQGLLWVCWLASKSSKEGCIGIWRWPQTDPFQQHQRGTLLLLYPMTGKVQSVCSSVRCPCNKITHREATEKLSSILCLGSMIDLWPQVTWSKAFASNPRRQQVMYILLSQRERSSYWDPPTKWRIRSWRAAEGLGFRVVVLVAHNNITGKEAALTT